MNAKWLWAVLVGVLGAALYVAIAMATPPSGVSNPTWSPVVGRFGSGIDATAKADIDAGAATDFWQVRISAKGATDIHIVDNITGPGGKFGRQAHPGQSLVVVKSGTLSVYHAPDCKRRDIGPG